MLEIPYNGLSGEGDSRGLHLAILVATCMLKIDIGNCMNGSAIKDLNYE